jgi:hypothetical protein
LCAAYVAGDNTRSIDAVVKRMCQMKYLYDYCDMVRYLDRARARYEHDWDEQDWSVHDRAENMALGATGSRYPQVWPWMKEKGRKRKKKKVNTC